MIRLLLFLVTLGSASGVADAQDRGSVVLFADEPTMPVVARTYEELVAMGLRVSSAPSDVSVADVRALGDESGAVAVVHVSGRGAVSIFVAGEESPRRIASADDPAVVALATAEILRGCLVDVPAAASPVEEPGAPAEAAVEERSEAHALTLHVGPTVLLSPGAVPDQLALTLGGELYPSGRVFVELVADVGLPGATITGKHDEIPVWTAVLGMGVGYALLPAEGSFDASVSAGVAGLVVLFETPSQRNDVALAALPYLRFVGRARLGGPVTLRADAAGALALPSPALEIKGKSPTFGRPLVTVGLSVELRL